MQQDRSSDERKSKKNQAPNQSLLYESARWKEPSCTCALWSAFTSQTANCRLWSPSNKKIKRRCASERAITSDKYGRTAVGKKIRIACARKQRNIKIHSHRENNTIHSRSTHWSLRVIFLLSLFARARWPADQPAAQLLFQRIIWKWSEVTAV